jgi:site-specific DNA-cytosine methylase
MEDDKAVERAVAACGDIAIASGASLCKGMSQMNSTNHGTKKYKRMNNHILRFVDVALRVNARVVVLDNSAALGRQLKFRKLLVAAVRELRAAGYFVSVNVVNFKDHKVPNRGASESG